MPVLEPVVGGHGPRVIRRNADDLLICHAGGVHPFPRYLNLRRGAPAIAAWARSAAAQAARIRRWPGQLDVPRALVSEQIPDRTDLEYVCLLDTAATRVAPEITAVPRARGAAHIIVWNRMHLDGWIADVS